MSKKALQKTLANILADIAENSDTYRDLVSNRLIHEIVVDIKSIKEEVIKELLVVFNIKEGNKIPDDIMTVVESNLLTMYNELHKGFTPENFYKYSSTRDTFDLGQIIVNENNSKFTVTLASKPNRNADVFRKIQKIKQSAQTSFIKALNEAIEVYNGKISKGGELTKIDSSKFLDIGHFSDTAVARQRKTIAERSLFDFTQSSNMSPQAREFINKISQEISLSIEKEPGKIDSNTKISVFFESSSFNQLQGSTTKNQFASITNSLTKDLQIVLERLGAEYWVEQEGSSSDLQIIEAEVLNPIAKVKGKGIRNTIKRRKVNLRSSTATVKGKKPKVQRSPQVKIKPYSIKTPQESNSPASFPLELLAILNRRLPDTVMKNMGYPALENRTGRFANSVQATNIIATPKGFPSIEYTYQLNPYQTFEPGGPMGSTDRDPKRLIDRSIREIASEYAMMRFYTRRR